MTPEERKALRCLIDERRRAVAPIADCGDSASENRYRQGCRCAACKRVCSEKRTARRRRPNVAVHNRNGYSNGCRCVTCRADHNRYNLAQYHRAREAA